MALQAPGMIFPIPSIERLRQQWNWEDRFNFFLSGQQWTLTSAGTFVLQAATAGNIGGNGLYTPSAATINLDMYLFRTTSQFLFQDGSSFSIKAILKWAQAATNQAAVHFGFMSAPAAATIVDTTGVPKASYSGALIYTKAGSIYYQAGCSVGASQQNTASNKVAGGSLAQELRIDVKCTNGVADIQFFVDEDQLLDESTAWSQPIKQSLTYSGAVAMTPMIAVKQCSAVAQPINVRAFSEQALYGSW